MRWQSTHSAVRGQTLVEYALLIALVAVTVVGSLIAFQTAVKKSYEDNESELQKAFPNS